MKAEKYKQVKAMAEAYIAQGKPLAAGNIQSQYKDELTSKQFYELSAIVSKALSKQGDQI